MRTPLFKGSTMDLKAEIDMYMHKASIGEAEMSEEIIERFGERCKESIRRQFNPEKRDFSIRMSSIGKPLCQQQMEKAGAERERMKPELKMKFAYGDLTEALMMAIMEAADIKIEGFQEKVSYKLGKTNIKGTLDVIIDGKVYDIKSVSKFGFEFKFGHPDGFQKMVDDDAFGYVSQGYLYGEAKELPFGGWIAMCKETGKYSVLKTPVNGEPYKRKAIADARKNADSLNRDDPFKRCFEPKMDTYYKKATGEHCLELTCSYCDFKKACWGDRIEFRKASGKSKSWKWYFND